MVLDLRFGFKCKVLCHALKLWGLDSKFELIFFFNVLNQGFSFKALDLGFRVRA
jgi:hypothetical protein